MDKYAVVALLPKTIEVVQSESLTPEEEEIISNYALPFGSDWGRVIGARSVKVFPISKQRLCLAYTVILRSNSQHRRAALHCLASIRDSSQIDQLIRTYPDWINKAVEPFVEKIENRELARAFKESLSLRISNPSLGCGCFWLVWLGHWLRSQFHFTVTPTFTYHNAQSWTESEEYARRLYLATNWQRQLVNLTRRVPLVGKLVPTPNLPSLATLSLSRGEFTNITILANPTNPLRQ